MTTMSTALHKVERFRSGEAAPSLSTLIRASNRRLAMVRFFDRYPGYAAGTSYRVTSGDGGWTVFNGQYALALARRAQADGADVSICVDTLERERSAAGPR